MLQEQRDRTVTEARACNQLVEAKIAAACLARDRAIVEIALEVERGERLASLYFCLSVSCQCSHCQENLKTSDLGT